MRLGEAAIVRSGLVLARKLSREPTEYRYPLLTLRSINPDGTLEKESLDIFDSVERLGAEYLAQKNDVVVRLSSPYSAVLIDDSSSGMLVSSNFVFIRANENWILPEYVFWLLNTSKVRKQIFENTSSNMLGAIKPKFFTDFEIDLLPIASQQKVATLNLLARRETQLLKNLANEKDKLYAFTIDRVQSKMRKESRI